MFMVNKDYQRTRAIFPLSYRVDVMVEARCWFQPLTVTPHPAASDR